MNLAKRATNKLNRLLMRGLHRFRSKLRVCVVGYGEIAPDHIDSYELSGRAAVTGVSDVRASALAAALNRSPSARGYRDYRQMFAELKPDVVSICTWPQSHAAIVVAAAEAGVRGIMCEKPLALALGEVTMMLRACDQHGAKLAGGHQYRFHPNFVAAAETLREWGAGQVKRIHGCIQGSLSNNGPHLIDTIRLILGDPPCKRVSCVCRRELGQSNRGMPVEEAASGVVEFEDGTVCEITTGVDAPVFFQIQVETDRGILVVTPQSLKADGVPTPRVGGSAMRRTQFNEFLRWISGRQATYLADGEQSARTTELVLAMYESMRVGQPITLPLTNPHSIVTQLWASDDAAGPEVAAASLDYLPGDERLALDGGRRSVQSWYATKPKIGFKELGRLIPVILSKQLCCTDGHLVSELECRAAQYYGSARAVASTSGTAAIHVALGALGLNPGDEVITTPLSDMGSVIPILSCNCLPVFADVDPVTGNLTAESIAAKLNDHTRAVVLVHLFGQPAEVGPIRDLCRERGVALIEDCSQAHGAEYHGQKVGTFGDFGTFSLQQSKQITCGDGGLTLVNRPDLEKRAALFVDKGWDRKLGLRSHLFLGMNYRMTEMQAAVALAQLERLPGLLAARRDSAEALVLALGSVIGVLPPPQREYIRSAWWMFPLRIDEAALGITTDAVGDALIVEGVPMRRHYLPVPLFEYDMLKYRHTFGTSGFPFTAFPYRTPDIAQFPGFHEFNQNLLFIPWSHSVRSTHVAAMASAVSKVIRVLSHAAAKATSLSEAACQRRSSC